MIANNLRLFLGIVDNAFESYRPHVHGRLEYVEMHDIEIAHHWELLIVPTDAEHTGMSKRRIALVQGHLSSDISALMYEEAPNDDGIVQCQVGDTYHMTLTGQESVEDSKVMVLAAEQLAKYLASEFMLQPLVTH